MHCLPGGLFKGDPSHLNAEFLVSKISFPLLANYTHMFLGCEFFEGQEGEVLDKCAE